MPVTLPVWPWLLLALAGDGHDAGFTVAIGGDVSFARGIQVRAESEGWEKVLAPLSEHLSKSDARIVNLESAFGACLDGGTTDHPRLCAHPTVIPWLSRAGITSVTVANNHALDAGPGGLEKSATALRRSHITVFGADAARTGIPQDQPLGPITIVTANLSRSAWSPGRTVAIPSPTAVAKTIQAARRRDPRRPVLVILHGGRELDPSPSGFEQAYAETAVQAGAAAVVFHGSHVAHSLAAISGVPVHWGLGNLLFDQHLAIAATGRILRLRFRPGLPAEVLGDDCVESTTGKPCSGGNP